MTWKYEDMLTLPHHVSARHAPMAMIDRAAQFAPFAALTGYDDAIRETARSTEQPIDLDESTHAQINDALKRIAEQICQEPSVDITFFKPDRRKDGGAYVTLHSQVKKLDTYEGCLVLKDGTQIFFSQIVNIET